jgi:CHAT domain-containing protein
VVLGNGRFQGTYHVDFQGVARDVEFDPLPGVVEEATAVAAVLGVEPLLDAAATLAAVLRVQRGVPVLHVATHGVLDEAYPEASFLALADGPLTAHFLYQYDSGIRATLVVLSACQTGLGHAHPDSAIGLANAFLIAGASSVVSTLWQISDDVPPRMMTHFYTALVNGDTISASLRAAQIAVLSDEATRDPYCWAAFKLTGRLDNPLLAPSALETRRT